MDAVYGGRHGVAGQTSGGSGAERGVRNVGLGGVRMTGIERLRAVLFTRMWEDIVS